MKFKKIRDEGNVYGFEVIEILGFNYDGEGSSIGKFDGDLQSIHINDLELIMFGDPGSGNKWYRHVEKSS